MIKSPLRYPGGKSRAVKFLQRFIPPFSEFREPLFGGGSFSIYMVQKYPTRIFKASDINYDLFCFWNELKSNSENMINEIYKVYEIEKNGRRLFDSIMKKRNDDLTSLQRAVDFFLLNRITFSGVVDSGGYSEQAFQKRFTKSSIERLKSTSKIIQNIEFSHTDYSALLEEHGNDVFIFLDPPYYSATKSKLYGKNGNLHVNFDHELFFQKLNSCTFNWLITYDNSEFVKELYKDYFIIEWQLQYGMNNYKKKNSAKGEELLIANYDLKEVENLNVNLQSALFSENV
ncbi:MAG TPA: DNA adenine methylase [Ignavibacteria bacterium]|nr:DNA adenine methylase [Ignavibacteria bacterium]